MPGQRTFNAQETHKVLLPGLGPQGAESLQDGWRFGGKRARCGQGNLCRPPHGPPSNLEHVLGASVGAKMLVDRPLAERAYG